MGIKFTSSWFLIGHHRRRSKTRKSHHLVNGIILSIVWIRPREKSRHKINLFLFFFLNSRSIPGIADDNNVPRWLFPRTRNSRDHQVSLSKRTWNPPSFIAYNFFGFMSNSYFGVVWYAKLELAHYLFVARQTFLVFLSSYSFFSFKTFRLHFRRDSMASGNLEFYFHLMTVNLFYERLEYLSDVDISDKMRPFLLSWLLSCIIGP